MLLKELTVIIDGITSDIVERDVRITVSCLLYDYLDNLPNKFDLRKTANTFKEYFISSVYDRKYKNRTIGYGKIEKLIKTNKYKLVSSMRKKDIKAIIDNFNNVQLETVYDPYINDSTMFGLSAYKNTNEKIAFEHLNSKILRPIARYMKDKYDSKFSNLQIIEVSDTIKPAREILINYLDIPSDRIFKDLTSGKILFDKMPSVIRLTKDSFIQIII